MKSDVLFLLLKTFRVGCSSAENITSNSLQFGDLNNDVLLDISDKIAFEDLISLTETNSRFRDLISRHYALKNRIQEKLIHLKPWWSQKIYPEEGSILFYHSKLCAKFLRIFRKWISRIKFENSYNSLAENALNEYCFESLSEITLLHNVKRKFSWPKPFQKVSSMHLKIQNFDGNKINFTEIFPSLRHLHIEHATCIDFCSHFPHLERMEFPIYKYNHLQYSVDAIEPYVRFMELNPQIRNVHLNLMLDLSREGSLKLLQVTNEKLPNLKVLELTLHANAYGTTQYLNETTHFKNVEKLILHTADESTDVLPIVFDQLVELEIIGLSHTIVYTNSKWFNFVVKNHKLLKILNINYKLNVEQWKLIADNLPLIEEISTYWLSRNDGSGLIAIMNRETNLKVVTLNMELSTARENYTDLCDLLYPKWQIDGELKSVMSKITFLRNIHYNDKEKNFIERN